MPNKAKKRNGFSLIESLCALMSAALTCTLISACMVASLRLYQSVSARQSQFALLQLREMAALCQKVYTEEGSLYMENGKEVWEVAYHNGRLVKKSGYQILMEDLEAAYFEQEGSEIFLHLVQNGQSSLWQIA